MNRACFLACSAFAIRLFAADASASNEDDIPASVTARATFAFPVPEARAISRGAGIVLFDTAEYPRGLIRPDSFSWDEPNAPYTIAIGLDTFNPPPTDTEVTQTEDGKPKYPMGWFDEAGNWYDRPQREISIHVDGVEVHNMLSPVEYRTGEPLEIEATVRFVIGAALLDLTVAGEQVLDDFALLGIEPFDIGTTYGVVDEAIEARQLVLDPDTTSPAHDTAEPVRVNVFDAYFVHGGDRTPKTEADFSGIPENVARVVATLTLDEPEVGYDHWDKKGVFYIWDKNADGSVGTRYELLRYITPFRKGWTWKADVTHLLPLLADQRTLQCDIGTYMKGWLVSLDLDFYPGQPERTPIAIEHLWTGDVEIGNPDNPPSKTFVDQTITAPEDATEAHVYITATGHGMSPNTDNAGEFMPLGRTLTVSSEAGEVIEWDNLWDEDVYLNPCRPQRGTWKFDRAGWAPGDLVLPWSVDVSHLLSGEHTLTVGYELDEYLNQGRGQTWAPHHWTHGYVVFCGDHAAK
ncbi:MAG: peptide-N-glycosidase F-related protein [Planctomycetota bacterium]